MFNLGRLKHLADLLGLQVGFILNVLDDFDANPHTLVKEWTLWRADRSKKPRDVISVQGRWRHIQQRIYTKLLLPRLKPLQCSHGGVKRRSAVTNARAHLSNTFAYVADMSKFFPSILCPRVNDLFLRQACSYEVARILTRLCTFNFHLALGLVTSPILANEIFKPIDRRISDACRKMGLTYSRFVDDITISGKYNLKTSGVDSVVRDIIERHGFSLAASKTDWGRWEDGMTVTGVRIKRDHLDASQDFIRELDRLLADHASLANDGHFDGPLLLEGELFGKAHYACRLNPGRRRAILGKLQAIDWPTLMKHAVNRDLCRLRDRMVPLGEPRPDCIEHLPGRAGVEAYRQYHETTTVDDTIAPWSA